jgi:hypothetical protein
MIRNQPFAAALVVFVLSLVAIQPAPAATAAVRAACTGDAQRLCSSVIRDAAKRHACMHAHAAQLSKGCIAAIRKGK